MVHQHIRAFCIASALSLSLTVPVLAQNTPVSPHAGHKTTVSSPTDTASTIALKAANDKMHKDMDIAYTGDADIDFLRGMIAHHQGAIDMARVVITHGKDAKIRKLAQDIITAQDTEITMMKQWLSKKAAPPKAKP